MKMKSEKTTEKNILLQAKDALKNGDIKTAQKLIEASKYFNNAVAYTICRAQKYYGLPEFGLDGQVAKEHLTSVAKKIAMENIVRLDEKQFDKMCSCSTYIYKWAKGGIMQEIVLMSKDKFPNATRYYQELLFMIHKEDYLSKKDDFLNMGIESEADILSFPIDTFFAEDIRDLILKHKENQKNNSVSFSTVERLLNVYTKSVPAYKDINNKPEVQKTIKAYEQLVDRCERQLSKDAEHLSQSCRDKYVNLLTDANKKIKKYLIAATAKNEKAIAEMYKRRNAYQRKLLLKNANMTISEK